MTTNLKDRAVLIAEQSTPWLLAASAFTIPVSSTAKSIVLALTLITIMLVPANREMLKILWQKPWCKAAILLFGLSFLACFWSNASWSLRGLVLEKYSKLLYLPILVAGFRDTRSRNLCLHAFLLAMTITAALSVFQTVHFVLSLPVRPDYVFRNHIMTGMMMGFAAFVAGWYAIHSHGWQRPCYLLLIALFGYQTFFIAGGRMAYLSFLFLMLLLVFVAFPGRRVIIPALTVCLLAVASYLLSPSMQYHVKQLVHEVQHYQQKKNTSVGFRIQFHQYAWSLFKERPLTGHGSGGYADRFEKDDPIPAWGKTRLEPHSQYWLVAAEFGIPGLLLLAFFFISLLVECLRLPHLSAMGLAVLLPFLIGNLSDSLLLYSGSGYFFILFMALCLSDGAVFRKAAATG